MLFLEIQNSNKTVQLSENNQNGFFHGAFRKDTLKGIGAGESLLQC